MSTVASMGDECEMYNPKEITKEFTLIDLKEKANTKNVCLTEYPLPPKSKVYQHQNCNIVFSFASCRASSLLPLYQSFGVP